MVGNEWYGMNDFYFHYCSLVLCASDHQLRASNGNAFQHLGDHLRSVAKALDIPMPVSGILNFLPQHSSEPS